MTGKSRMGARHTHCTVVHHFTILTVVRVIVKAPSVLLYDNEYRYMQADEKFEWGTYRQDLRDFQLVSKRDNPISRAY
jgi:hypothetical protein